jgi:omega-hydroxy-beta-dihydromenaquinone-9 sulfotransferase
MTGGSASEAATGYPDRPWIPRIWTGMSFSGWVSVLAGNVFRIHPKRLAMALLILLFGMLNSALGAMQRVFFGRRIARTEIRQHPIIIVGHWRSGTTLLHELLALDPRHTAPSTYACFAPNHFLLTRRIIPPILSLLMPARRPADNMAAGWDHPQEDEFALCNMGVPSPYLTMAFPNQPPQHAEYLSLQGVPTEEVERWKRALRWFLQCVTLECGKRIVLKSPPHTGRIKILLEMFPDARFVHIVRDPYVVFASTMHLWQRLYRDQGLQKPRFDGLEEYIFRTFEQMYDAFERDRALLSPARFCQVRYEDLVADMPSQMRRIYDTLELGECESALPAIREYADAHRDYVRNRFELPPETRERISRRWADWIRTYGYA